MTIAHPHFAQRGVADQAHAGDSCHDNSNIWNHRKRLRPYWHGLLISVTYAYPASISPYPALPGCLCQMENSSAYIFRPAMGYTDYALIKGGVDRSNDKD